MRRQCAQGLRLRELVEQLRSEGWVVRPHHIEYALRAKVIDGVEKVGGWNRYTQSHLENLRKYFAERSRSQDARGNR